MNTLRALMVAAAALGLLGICGMAAVQMSASQLQTEKYRHPQSFKARGDSMIQYRYLSDDQMKAYGHLELVGFGGLGTLLALLLAARLAKCRAQV
jgi:hypothetical protein